MAVMSETSTISQNDLKHERIILPYDLFGKKKKGSGNQLRLQTFERVYVLFSHEEPTISLYLVVEDTL